MDPLQRCALGSAVQPASRSQSYDAAKMDVLSAATETVANADAIEAIASAAANASAAAETSSAADTAAAESSEMDVDEGAAPPRSKDSGAAQPPAVPPAVRAAHELLLKNAEDIKAGT